MVELEGRNLNLMDQVESLQRDLYLLQKESALADLNRSEKRSELKDQFEERLQLELNATKEELCKVVSNVQSCILLILQG